MDDLIKILNEEREDPIGVFVRQHNADILKKYRKAMTIKELKEKLNEYPETTPIHNVLVVIGDGLQTIEYGTLVYDSGRAIIDLKHSGHGTMIRCD